MVEHLLAYLANRFRRLRPLPVADRSQRRQYRLTCDYTRRSGWHVRRKQVSYEMNNGSNKPFAVITGASSGIGYELAAQFAQHGFDILIVSSGEGISDAAERLKGFGGQVESVQADL